MDEKLRKLQPPYYAVIFTSQRTEGDNGYGKMAQAMEDLAAKQQGFLGMESARDGELGITVSYWETQEDIKRWKDNASHKVAQEKGKDEWYQHYTVRVCKVERDYFFEG
ncbi:antibiotic biosynthesis monooxygenase family protein [Radiobacillus deserti]|uniref:Antibiotic biosynthesis monooxygenase n=1 Tax=Radiobacillus deserti TaxID=2594883 RepID=A0A516KJN9_9BACI|nr:antibiotic biosynthesis monooxygenase [Radiobacillus deserti]QDP41604.1 antibiotic biosynthesis monooxygenase [Radiobacillus deserti]